MPYDTRTEKSTGYAEGVWGGLNKAAPPNPPGPPTILRQGRPVIGPGGRGLVIGPWVGPGRVGVMGPGPCFFIGPGSGGIIGPGPCLFIGPGSGGVIGPATGPGRKGSDNRAMPIISPIENRFAIGLESPVRAFRPGVGPGGLGIGKPVDAILGDSRGSPDNTGPIVSAAAARNRTSALVITVIHGGYYRTEHSFFGQYLPLPIVIVGLGVGAPLWGPRIGTPTPQGIVQ